MSERYYELGSDPITAERYAIVYHSEVDAGPVEMLGILPGDFGRAVEALKGQGVEVIWGGFMSDFNNWGRAAIRRRYKIACEPRSEK